MDVQSLTLYDWNGTKPWSPNVIRAMILLKYKKVKYSTIELDGPGIQTTGIALGVTPATAGAVSYTVPIITLTFADGSHEHVMNNDNIAARLEVLYPDPPLILANDRLPDFSKLFLPAFWPLVPHLSIVSAANIIKPVNPEDAQWYLDTRPKALGSPITGHETVPDAQDTVDVLRPRLAELRTALEAHGGPFILGGNLSLMDFKLAGWLAWPYVAERPMFDNLLEAGGEPLQRFWQTVKVWLPQAVH